tara:strand:+ start:420 stop:1220 length:801 start_codon:yes stop_codon:yes gene_type:complete
MVRVALYEKGITFKDIHIKLCDQYSEGENLNKSFLKINPLATVPAISIDEEIIIDSVNIIKRLNTIIGKNQLNLYPTNEPDTNSIIRDTTITEGTKFASTIGTIIPVFSAPLIQFMIKKLPFKSIIKILFKHPRRDRKIIFLSMYFFNFSKKLPMIGIKKFVDELIKFENLLSNENKYFYSEFSHIDINMMCVINRLKDLRLEECINTKYTPKIQKYWENLKNRESYTKGIINYYSKKEYDLIDEFYGNNRSEFLNHILKEIEQRN